MYRKVIYIPIILMSLSSCSNSSLEDFREEAEGITFSLVKELQAIHSRDELILRLPKLKKHFDNLVGVMVAAHEFKVKHPGDTPILTDENRLLSDALRAEFIRLYTIEGARDIVEKTQQDALYRLDAYLQKGELRGS